MARADGRRKCEACGLSGQESLEPMSIPWNALVRARTHEGNSVYICPECKTPLERTRRRFEASPAAAAAFRRADASISEIECELPGSPSSVTYEGYLPAMCDDGTIRLFEWPEAGLDAELVAGYGAVQALTIEVPGEDQATVAWAKERRVDAFRKLGLPHPDRAVRDWE